MDFILIGCNGKMGEAVYQATKETGDTIICGIDTSTENREFKSYKSIDDITENFDAIIDFSTTENHSPFIEFAKSHRKPYALFSTIYDKATIQAIEKASKKIAVLQCNNSSLGANAFFEMLENGCKSMRGADCVLTEYHHKNKIDTPSGTAKTIEKILKSNGINYTLQSFRVANEKGRHTIEFFLQDELISITHQAFSRSIFARGAIIAMHNLNAKKKGLYFTP